MSARCRRAFGSRSERAGEDTTSSPKSVRKRQNSSHTLEHRRSQAPYHPSPAIRAIRHSAWTFVPWCIRAKARRQGASGRGKQCVIKKKVRRIEKEKATNVTTHSTATKHSTAKHMHCIYDQHTCTHTTSIFTHTQSQSVSQSFCRFRDTPGRSVGRFGRACFDCVFCVLALQRSFGLHWQALLSIGITAERDISK